MLSAHGNYESENRVSLIDNSVVDENEVEDSLVDCGDFANKPFEPLKLSNSHVLDAAEFNGVAYIVGYSISKLMHKTCRDNLNCPYDYHTTSTDESMFCRLKCVGNVGRWVLGHVPLLVTSNFSLPNTSDLEIGLLLRAACQQQFACFLLMQNFDYKSTWIMRITKHQCVQYTTIALEF